MQPRKQQEIRNTQTYFPPLELMGPDTTGEGFQQMLNQMRMRDVNQSINPFTGDSLDIEGDSLKLLQSADGEVKTAIVMEKLKMEAGDTRIKLNENKGSLRKVLDGELS